MWFAGALLLASCAQRGNTESPGGGGGGTTSPTSGTGLSSPPPGAGPSEVALQGELIQSAAVDDPWVAAVSASSPFPPGLTTIDLFVAVSTDPDALSDGLVAGLDPAVWDVISDRWDLEPGAVAGEYALPEDERDRFEWGMGGSSRVEPGKIQGWSGSASVFLPAPAELDWPTSLAAGQPLTLDYAGQGFDSSLAVVLDASGALTWSDDPVTVEEFYATNAIEATSETIPAVAFPVAGDFVVGMAACTRTYPADLTALAVGPTAVRACQIVHRKIVIE